MERCWTTFARLLVVSCATAALATAVQAQTGPNGGLDALAEAVEGGDSARVRQVLADPAFLSAIEAADQTAEVMRSVGQAENLDGTLRREAFLQAIRQASRALDEAGTDQPRAVRSADLYDLHADYLSFLQSDYLLYRIAGLPGPDRNNSAHIAAIEASTDEVVGIYANLRRLLPYCAGDEACLARRTALNLQQDAFANSAPVRALDLAGEAAAHENRAYVLFELESVHGSQVRAYEAARQAFDRAAAKYAEAAALIEAAFPGHPAAARLNAYRDRALERAAYAAATAEDRGPDRDNRPPPPPPAPPPPPPPPPPPAPPPPPGPPIIDENRTLAQIARAQTPEVQTAYQRACQASTEENPQSATVDVYYATSRRPVARPDAVRDLYFGTRREVVANDRVRLHYGQAAVNVPCERPRGELPRPEQVLVFQLEPLSSVKHFHLRGLRPFETLSDWLGAIEGDIATSRRREVLVYVHGYNNGFSVASYRAAQLHADLGIDGATVFYSWASRERLLAYGRDRETVEDPTEYRTLADTLMALRGTEATTVYLVAHSMGNRLMMAALDDLARRPDRPVRRFDELVMGSADIEERLFRDYWANARTLVDRATLYASNRDKAMWAANLFAGPRRIGDAGNRPLTFDGVRTIDTSEVGGSGIGHDDYSAGGLSNLQASLWFNLQPERRCILAPQTAPDAADRWWRIRPIEPAWQSDCTHASFGDVVEVARIKGSFSDAAAWMNQVYPPSQAQPQDNSYAARLRRLFRSLLNR